MRLLSFISIALGQVLMAAATAQTTPLGFERLIEIPRTQANPVGAFQFGHDGRLYGASSNPVALWSGKPGESGVQLLDNPNKIRLGGHFIRSRSGLFYASGGPNDRYDEFGYVSCPYFFSEQINGEVFDRRRMGFIYRFGPGLSPEKLPVSESAPVCPSSPLAIDGRDDLYFVSRINAELWAWRGGDLPIGTRLYKLSADGIAMEMVHEFEPDGVFDPTALIAGQDGRWLYGINISETSGQASYLYRVRTDGTGFQKLREFTGAGGEGRVNGNTTLLETGGYLYGTTWNGGGACTTSDGSTLVNGCGTLYRIKADGTEAAQVLHNFQWSDGRVPSGALALGGDGNIYGTTQEGGSGGYGTVYRIKPTEITGPLTGVETRLYQFADPSHPNGLVAGLDGKLYGTFTGDPNWVYALDIGYVPPGPVITFSASPVEVVWSNGMAQPATLTWSTTGAVSCTASGDWTGAKGTAASETVMPAHEGDSTYILSCDNGSGLPEGMTEQSVTIKAIAPPAGVAIMAFAATPASVVSGGTVTLDWTTANALSCIGSWSSSPLAADQLAAGSVVVEPNQEPGEKTYTLTCQGQAAGDRQERQTQVMVTYPTSGEGSGIVSKSGGALPGWLLLALLSACILGRRKSTARN